MDFFVGTSINNLLCKITYGACCAPLGQNDKIARTAHVFVCAHAISDTPLRFAKYRQLIQSSTGTNIILIIGSKAGKVTALVPMSATMLKLASVQVDVGK